MQLGSKTQFSKVEQAFHELSGAPSISTQIPYILVDNFPNLGLFTSLRFLEWVAQNPTGVISLPTGKSPEFFIKWTKFLLENWDNEKGKEVLEKYGIIDTPKPSLENLHFVQLDEFYPISSAQHNSFFNYVSNYYIKGFGLNPKNALLINSDEIPLPHGLTYTDIWPNSKVDLSLRFSECKTKQEKLQQEAIFMIDNWCMQYESAIRAKGGIGFFLGGIGPDGHIAFNTRGSDFNSTTRLTETNFETQAVAATDLGGIEISANRLVITIGLQTITFNENATAIIIAAGEAKAGIIQQTLEHTPSNLYPGSVLSKLPNARFYLTEGAALRLSDRVKNTFLQGEWSPEKTERAIIGLCKKLNKYGHHLTQTDLQNDLFTKTIPGVSEQTVSTVINQVVEKIQRGMVQEKNEVFLHTGPHHDDIMLGILPHIANHFHEPSNEFHFAVLTSGFTAVTNKFVIQALENTKRFLEAGKIQMILYPDFFEFGFKHKRDKDIYHYLTKVASGNEVEKQRGFCHRLVRAVTEVYKVTNLQELYNAINDIVSILRRSYDGEKNPPKIQQLKGMIREFEEELVWAHYGVKGENVTHNRLGFYKGDIFTEQPEKDRDVIPVLEMFRRINPTVLSLTFDPEGSGPDTHYKVLQTTADALREWKKEKDLSNLRVWGYRNVWYKFNPSDANVIVPVSLNDMSNLNDVFTNCYLSQVEASFPSYELNGKFSKVAQKIWVNQLRDLQLLLGKEFFYQNTDPRVRASHGLIFYKEMTVDVFLGYARELKKSAEGSAS
ncbi:MAG: glucosamine-6-phosphate isomerase [Bacteroidetes bacterium B1(2017)]|nr:MAG: glucosamine-6-phosphate isomerase [Bacteroidetes bacterium B1(2017)]